MTLHLPAPRAAEDFARALEGTADQDVADRYADLVSTATLLREQPVPTPRPEFVAELRSQLMTAAATELHPQDLPDNVRPLAPVQARRSRHLGAAAAAIVLVGTTAGVAAASDASLPGSPLYPIKRGIESAQVAMSSSDAAKGDRYLAQAESRVDEVRSMLESSDASSEQIAATLGDFTDRAAKGSDLIFRAFQSNDESREIADVRAFAAKQMAALEELVALAPPTSGPDFGAAADLLADIDQQARVLCSDCSPAAALTAPVALKTPGTSSALNRLVTAPAGLTTQRIDAALKKQLAAAASSAEEKAKSTPLNQPATPIPGVTGSNGSVPGQTPTSGKGTAPVKELVTGITSGLPVPTTVTKPVEDLTAPVTDLVDNTLGTLTGGN